jgi:hypothetical protein
MLKEKGEWNKQSDEEAKIIALEAQMKANIGKNKANTNPKPKASPKPFKKPCKDCPAWMWCRHSTEQCEFKGIGKAKPKRNTNGKNNDNKDQEQVKLARALNTVIEIMDSSDEE